MKKFLEHFEEYVSSALLVLLFVVLVWQILSRQVLNSPAIWTEELARLIFIYMSMFACSSAVKERHHVNIAFFVEMLPPKGLLAISILMDTVVVALLCYLIHLGWQVAMRNQFLELITLGISSFWLYNALCLGAALMVVRLVQRIINDVRIGSIPMQTQTMS